MVLNERWVQCRQVLNQAAGYLEDIKKRLHRLGLSEEFEPRLTRKQTAIDNDNITLRLVALGKNKNGKSTLINALIGPSSNEAIRAISRAQMNMGYGTTTATLTEIQYGDKIEIIAKYRRTGKMEVWDESRYHKEARVDNPEIQKIERYIYKYPSELLEKNLVLIDSPGLDDTEELTKVTEQAIEEVDAALFVLRSDGLYRPEEARWFNDNLNKLRTFIVVNDMSGKTRSPESYLKLQGAVWNELVSKQGVDEPYSPEKLAEKYDIYIVDAKSALEAKWDDNASLVEKSGLWALEAALAKLLQIDGEQVDVFWTSWQHNTEQIIVAITNKLEEQILELRTEYKTKQGDLQQLTDLLGSVVQTRPQVMSLINQSRNDTLNELKLSLKDAFEVFRNDYLPSLVQVQQDGAWGNLKEGFTKKKQEAVQEEVTKELNRKINDWQQYVASEILIRRVHTLQSSVNTLIEDVLQQEKDAQTASREAYRVNNYDSDSDIDPMERFLSGIGGLVGGGFFGAFAGAVYGKEGAIGASIGGTVAVIGAGLLGVASLPVMIGVAAIGGALGLLVNGENIGERLQEKISLDAKKAMAGFEDQVENQLVKHIEDRYSELQKKFGEAFETRIIDYTQKVDQARMSLSRAENESQPMIQVLEHEKTEIEQILYHLNHLPPISRS